LFLGVLLKTELSQIQDFLMGGCSDMLRVSQLFQSFKSADLLEKSQLLAVKFYCQLISEI